VPGFVLSKNSGIFDFCGLFYRKNRVFCKMFYCFSTLCVESNNKVSLLTYARCGIFLNTLKREGKKEHA